MTFHSRHIRKYLPLLLLMIIGTVILAACDRTDASAQTQTAPAQASTQTTPTSTTSITPSKIVEISIIENNNRYSFNPATLTISKGTEVKWINQSDAPHTATSDDSTFTSSSTLMQNQSYGLIFPTAGTYKFHCSIHTYMQGTITVTA